MLRRLDFGATKGRIGALFMVGSACFALASLPALAAVLTGWAIATVYFVGSLFFTAAAALQLRASTTAPDRLAGAVQLVGTVLFNVNTGAAFADQLDPVARDLIIWSPDAAGSAAFLISSLIAVLAAQWQINRGLGRAGARRRRPDWPTPLRRLGRLLRRDWREATRDLRSDEMWIAGLNLGGSIAFGVSAIAAFEVPRSGSLLDASAVNSATLIGALLFFAAAFLLVEERAG
jgi:hypothetical protein